MFELTVDMTGSVIDGRLFDEDGIGLQDAWFEQYNVKYEIVTECGPTGWPVVTVKGEYKNVINILTAMGYDEDELTTEEY